MMKYPKEYLEEIKTRLKVSQVVGKYVQLKKRGKEFVGLSPFKNEKTPSFTVNDEKGFYHCFSSSEHGNIFDFIMKTQSIGFGEAVKRLAAEAGMQQYRFSTFDQKKEKRFQLYKNILNDYKQFASENLIKNKSALEYLEKRDLTKKTLEEFKIGFIPDKTSSYEKLLKNYSEEEINQTGIFYKNERLKKYVDRFNSRIIFPVNNLTGDTIAFGGRIINSAKLAKYINSPETEFYKKGKILFNLDKARTSKFKTDEVVIVEGYMDVISLYDKGVKNVISNSGTAITENQIQLLWKFFSKPIVCLDGDESGQQATLRIAEKLISLISDKNKIFFSVLDNGVDPDDFVKKNGQKAFEEFLQKKEIIQDFIWNKKIQNLDSNDPFMISRFEKEMRNLTYTIKDETLKKHILESFLNRMRLLTPNQQLKKNYSFKKNQRTQLLDETKKIHRQRDNISKEQLTEFSILYLVLNFPTAAREKVDELSKLNFSQPSEQLKNELINSIIDSKDCEIHKDIFIKNEILISEINNKNMVKNLVQRKNISEIEELIQDFISEFNNINYLKKIDDLEKNLIKNFDESSFSELIKLKNQINRD